MYWTIACQRVNISASKSIYHDSIINSLRFGILIAIQSRCKYIIQT